jgi:hypothetical protein
MSSIRDLIYTLTQYEPQFFEVYGNKKGLSLREAVDLVDELVDAAIVFRDRLKQASTKSQ